MIAGYLSHFLHKLHNFQTLHKVHILTFETKNTQYFYSHSKVIKGPKKFMSNFIFLNESFEEFSQNNQHSWYNT